MGAKFWMSAIIGGWLLAMAIFAVNAGVESYWCAILAFISGMNVDDAINRYFAHRGDLRRARSAHEGGA